jgi:RNA polymerase sigma factor (sigma-70 family)
MNDVAFARKCAGGDKKSWDEFVNRYSRLIYNYIHATLRIKGLDNTAENIINDLFQEVYLSLVKDNCRKLKGFKGKNNCSLASWLRQVTINITIDYIRRAKPAVAIDAREENEERLIQMPGLIVQPDLNSLSNKERFKSLLDCIKRLSVEDKYFLELHINQNLSLEEIRKLFRCSRGMIDMRKSRIIEKLRQCFKKKGFELSPE